MTLRGAWVLAPDPEWRWEIRVVSRRSGRPYRRLHSTRTPTRSQAARINGAYLPQHPSSSKADIALSLPHRSDDVKAIPSRTASRLGNQRKWCMVSDSRHPSPHHLLPLSTPHLHLRHRLISLPLPEAIYPALGAKRPLSPIPHHCRLCHTAGI